MDCVFRIEDSQVVKGYVIFCYYKIWQHMDVSLVAAYRSIITETISFLVSFFNLFYQWLSMLSMLLLHLHKRNIDHISKKIGKLREILLNFPVYIVLNKYLYQRIYMQYFLKFNYWYISRCGMIKNKGQGCQKLKISISTLTTNKTHAVLLALKGPKMTSCEWNQIYTKQ